LLLWDHEMASVRGRLGDIPAAKRFALAVSVLDWTIQTMVPPIETEQVSSYLEQGLRVCREAVQAGRVSVQLSEEMLDEYDEIDEVADEPGTSHMLSALLACCETGEELSGEQLYGVLSFCYEGSLDREGIDNWTIEKERANPRCLAVIDYQKSLIARMAE